MAKDVNFSNVVLLMHMDGADNGTAFADQKGKVVSVFGNTTTKTAVKKFGTASAYFDGTGDFLTVTSGADFAFGTDDFTIETWVMFDDFAEVRGVFGKFASWASSVDFMLWAGSDQILVFAAGNNVPLIVGTQAAINAGIWYHVAVSRASGTTRLFLNGALQDTSTVSNNIGNVNSTLTIGGGNTSTFPMKGYIDDLRITKGVARYTADFTPPTEAFPNGGYEVGGTVLDINGNPVARTFRAYRRDTGALLGAGVSNASTGTYSITVDHDGEVQVVMLDDVAGTVENDQILRTTPV